MVYQSLLSTVLLATLLGTTLAQTVSLNETCQEIASSVSSASGVFNIGSPQYASDINHWANSSIQNAACSFEPGTARDIAIALQILNKTQTPFAVKGGGHASNPRFSSTTGVQIAMSRYSDVVYNATTQTVVVGAGLIWDDVYAVLEPYGVNVVGGRVSGVGVAGFALGGGYSWLTNQYGLTIDTVQAYELVMPNGTITNVTATSSPDLFFALRGGYNNFGIVTKFTLQTFPQTQVWGGLIVYGADVLDKVNQATANFAAHNKDPKASIISTYNFVYGQPSVSELIFYDAPNPAPGIFDEFLSISSVYQDISTRSFLSLVQSSHANASSPGRVIFDTISLTDYPLSLLESIVTQCEYWGQTLTNASATFISYDVEPFLPTLFNHSTSPSAYPPNRTQGFLPLNLYFAWSSPASDDLMWDAVRNSSSMLLSAAIDAGQSGLADAPLYPNYAIFDTPLAKMYGANVPRLQAIKGEVDPDNVMGLTGGFKF